MIMLRLIIILIGADAGADRVPAGLHHVGVRPDGGGAPGVRPDGAAGDTYIYIYIYIHITITIISIATITNYCYYHCYD